MVNGEIQYQRWDYSRFTGLPGVSPGFREPIPDEAFSDSDRVIRDQSGIVRAVPVPMKLRQSYFCGRPSDEVTEFESLANMAALALLDADDLSEHFLASELCDLFRKPRGGVRYVFGEVSEVPRQFVARGWAAGVLQYPNGVLIDVPISESTPDSSHWMLLLHRLGWRRPKGSPLTAHRAYWNGNTEVTYDMLDGDWSIYPHQFAKHFANISQESFYSVLGSKDAPIDVNLASAFAIQLLTAHLATHQSVAPTDKRSICEELTHQHHIYMPRFTRLLSELWIYNRLRSNVTPTRIIRYSQICPSGRSSRRWLISPVFISKSLT